MYIFGKFLDLYRGVVLRYWFQFCEVQIPTNNFLIMFIFLGLKFLTDDLLAPVIGQNVHLESLELSECHHLTSSILQIVSSRFI